MREPKATFTSKLYSDCLQKILSFGEASQVWNHRLVSLDWYGVVPAALFQMRSATISYSDRFIVILCPNLTTVDLPRHKKKTTSVKYFLGVFFFRKEKIYLNKKTKTNKKNPRDFF